MSTKIISFLLAASMLFTGSLTNGAATAWSRPKPVGTADNFPDQPSKVQALRTEETESEHSSMSDVLVQRVASDFDYRIINGNQIEITGYHGESTDVSIPDELVGMTVTSIGYGAFQNRTELTGICFPQYLSNIGGSAFQGCLNLTALDFPESLTSIESYAFEGCTGITSLLLPSALKQLGNYAFQNCAKLETVSTNNGAVSWYYCFEGCDNLTTVTFEDQVTEISGSLSLQRLKNLNQVVISPSVTSIGDNAFLNCKGLTEITVPDSVKRIGASAFKSCTSLTDVRLGSQIESIGNYAFQYCTGLKQISLPSAVKSIGNYAFDGCKNLGNIALGLSLESIGDYAFQYCTGLTEIVFPSNLISIGAYAFYECSGLEHLKLGSALQTIGDWAFYGCSSLMSVTIGNSLESIGRCVFQNCKLLSKITIPDSVHHIGQDAFSGTPWLNGQANGLIYAGKVAYQYKGTMPANTSIVLKEGTTGIAEYAFSYKTLIGITIPDSVKTIGNYAFYECKNLSNVSLGKQLKSIGEHAFSGCSSLPEIKLPNSLEILGNYAFSQCASLTDVQLPDSITSIGDYAFSGCINLTEKIFERYPPKLSKISSGQFQYCHALEDIVIPDTVEMIDYSAFYSCNGLKKLTLSKSLNAMNSQAFGLCQNLSEITAHNGEADWDYSTFQRYGNDKGVEVKLTFGDGVNEVGGGLNLRGIPNLKEAVLPESLTSIGDGAFNQASDLTKINIPKNVNRIGERAFNECTSLPEINLPNSVEILGSYAFRQCSNLTDVQLPDSITSIGDYAFSGCINLTEKIFESYPPKLKKISTAQFQYCSALEDVVIPDTVEMIDYSAFYSCNGLKKLTLPESLNAMNSQAFGFCQNLSEITAFNGEASWSSSAFQRYSNDKGVEVKLTFGDGVDKIEGDLNLYGIPNLKEVVLPESLTSIGDSAFYQASDLTKINIPKYVKSIGGHAFSSCSSLPQINLPSSVESIGNYAFSQCASLTDVQLPDSITSIGDYAFSGCTNLTEKIFESYPPKLSKISSGQFQYCNALKDIVIPDTVEMIDYSAFYSCNGLKKLTLPERLNAMNSQAFGFCQNLSEITAYNGEADWDYSAFQRYGNDKGVEVKLIVEEGVGKIGERLNLRGIPNLKEVVLPESLISIGERTFSYCADLEKVNVPETVTQIGDNAFSNAPYVVIHTLPGSYADEYALEHNIMIAYVFDKSRITLNILLPKPETSGQYSGMKIIVENKETHVQSTITTTDSLRYAIGGLTIDDHYSVTLSNKYGTVLGSIDDVLIQSEQNEVTFTDLLETKTAHITVQDPNGKNVTNQTEIKWYDEAGNYLLQGNRINSVTVGMKLGYEVTLNTELGGMYKAPVQQSYTVANDNEIVIRLSPISIVAISGRVVDHDTGSAIEGASVSIVQTLNERYPKTVVTQTDSQGRFTAKVYDEGAVITISKPQYISETISKTDSSEYSHIGDIKIKKAVGPTITLNASFTYNAEDGKAASTAPFTDIQSANISLFNQTQNKQISSFSTQYPDIVLLDSAKAGDRIQVTISSRTNRFQQQTGIVTLNQSAKATMNFNLIQNGQFNLAYTESGNDKNVAIVYDHNGRLVKSYDYRGKKLTSDVLPQGGYTIISMGSSPFFNNIQSLDDLKNTGLTENKDYIRSSVTITNGKIVTAEIDSIPKLNESQLYYTDSENTLFSVNKASAVAGSYFTLKTVVDFKASYQNDVRDVKLLVDLPQDCDYITDSLLIGKTGGEYSIDERRLIIPLSNVQDIVRFCVAPQRGGEYQLNAFVEFTLHGKTILQPIGAASFKAEEMSINVPTAITAQKTTFVSGQVRPNAKIIVYDNDTVVGQTVAKKDGSWMMEIPLNNPLSYSFHDIYAQVQAPTGNMAYTEVKKLLYDESALEVSKVTMIYPYLGYEIVYDYLNPSENIPYYSFYPGSPGFTFKIEFTNNDPALISDVVLHVSTSSGKVVDLDAVYDEVNQLWVAKEDFDAYNLPVNVGVDFNTPSISGVSVSSESLIGSTLTAATDLSSIDLELARTYPTNVEGHSKKGIFGLGWLSQYDVTAKKETIGSKNYIYLNTPSGSKMLAEKEGAYIDVVSGASTASVSGDQIIVTEKNGTVLTFNEKGFLKTMRNTNKRQISFTYNNDGQLTKITTDTGDSIQLEYADGKVKKASASRTGDSVSYTYSGDFLTSVTTKYGTVRYTYDQESTSGSKNALTKIIYANDATEQFAYDVLGRLTNHFYEDRLNEMTYQYGPYNDVTATDASGNKTHFYFDGMGNIVNVITPDGSSSKSSYQNYLLPSGTSFEEGTDYSYEYDDRQNLTKVIDPVGGSISFTYDQLGNQTGVSDQNGVKTAYERDANGNVTSIVYADRSSETYTYDAKGNVAIFTDRKGQTTRLFYDDGNLPVKAEYADGTVMLYEYNDRGNPTSITQNAETTRIQYNQNGDMTRVVYPNGKQVSYTYDDYGRLASLTDNEGNTTNYSYDELGRLRELTDKDDRMIARYDYNQDGSLKKQTNGNGTYTSYTYANGMRSGITNYARDGKVLSKFLYTYNSLGYIDTMTGNDGTWSYEYDPLGQLIKSTSPNGKVTQYTYDPSGNRQTVSEDGKPVAYTANELNQYTKTGACSMQYDRNGNLIRKSDGKDVTTYAYDVHNRLIKMTSPDGIYEYEYDVFGNRSKVTVNGTATEYVNTPTGLGFAVNAYTDGKAASYIQGSGLTAQVSGDETYYYAYNHLGSTANITDADSEQVNRYTYDQDGKITNKTEGIANPFTYVGQYGIMDDRNGLYYMRARYVSQDTNSFITADPLGQNADLNMYRYAENNTVIYADITGEVAWIPIIAGAVVGLGTGFVVGKQAYDDAVRYNNSYHPEPGFTRKNPALNGLGAGVLAGLGAGLATAFAVAKIPQLCTAIKAALETRKAAAAAEATAQVQKTMIQNAAKTSSNGNTFNRMGGLVPPFILGNLGNKAKADPLKNTSPLKNAQPHIDPSGFVYEGVESNRLPGVTTTVYYKVMEEDMYGDLHEKIYMWDAWEYSQENPLITDENGVYAWDVPQGEWQVKYEKDGYETTYSDWLPVPPPQVDVNIGMVSYVQPTVARTTCYEDAVEIVFDKYMKASTLDAKSITVSIGGAPVSGKLELIDAEENPQSGELLVSKVRFIPDKAFDPSAEVAVTVSRKVQSYAGIALSSDSTQTMAPKAEPKEISIPDELRLNNNGTETIQIGVLPAQAAAGMKMRATVNAPSLLSIEEQELVLDENGIGSITAHALLAGEAVITFSLEGTDLTAQLKVSIGLPRTDSLHSSQYTITAEGYLIGAGLETTGTQLKAGFTNSHDQLVILHADGTVLSDDEIVGTGTEIQLVQNGQTIDSAAVVIAGDVTGDGIINIFDIMSIRDAIFEKYTLEGCYFKAADVYEDRSINIFDIMAVRDIIFAVN